MTVTETISTIRKKLARATSDATSEISRLRRAIRDKRHELAALRKTALPAEDVTARAATAVERDAAAWVGKHAGRFIRQPFRSGAGRPLCALGEPNEGSIVLPWTATDPMPWGALCAAEPERAVAVLMAIYGRVRETPEFIEGPRLVERAAIEARLVKELASLEETEEQAIDQCHREGLAIEHRLEVRQRRQAEQRKREVLQKSEEDLVARQRALDAQHQEDGRRTSRSQYLASR